MQVIHTPKGTLTFKHHFNPINKEEGIFKLEKISFEYVSNLPKDWTNYSVDQRPLIQKRAKEVAGKGTPPSCINVAWQIDWKNKKLMYSIQLLSKKLFSLNQINSIHKQCREGLIKFLKLIREEYPIDQKISKDEK